MWNKKPFRTFTILLLLMPAWNISGQSMEDKHDTLSIYRYYFEQKTSMVNQTQDVVFKENLDRKYADLKNSYEVDNAATPKKTWLDMLYKFFTRLLPSINFDFVIPVIRIFIYVALIILILYVLKRIFFAELSWKFWENRENNRPVIEDVVKLSESDWENKISLALEKRDFRLAIRYYFLLLLKVISDKGWINLDSQKTNSDYIDEMKNRPDSGEFIQLSKAYEYIWFGELALSESSYKGLLKRFDQMINRLKV